MRNSNFSTIPEIPKRNTSNFFEQKKLVPENPAERPSRKALLEKTKLSNLRANDLENIPFLNQAQNNASAVCVNCKSKVPERDFLKAKFWKTARL